MLLWVTSVVSDSVRPHNRQPTRLSHPWDSPGKNTGVGCHFILQRMKVKSVCEVAHLCPTLSDPMDHSPPGSSIHGIFQARVLEWGTIAFSVNIKILICKMGIIIATYLTEHYINVFKILYKLLNMNMYFPCYNYLKTSF